MSTKKYLSPEAITFNLNTRTFFCISNTENISNESYGHDGDNDITWNF